MATHRFATPIRVGDIKNGITVDALDLVSISVNFKPVLETPKGQSAHIKYWRDQVIVSCVLHHAASGWTHTVTLSEHTGHSDDQNGHSVSNGVLAAAMWEAIKKEFPEFEKKILTLLAPHLPPGTIS